MTGGSYLQGGKFAADLIYKKAKLCQFVFSSGRVWASWPFIKERGQSYVLTVYKKWTHVYCSQERFMS